MKRVHAITKELLVPTKFGEFLCIFEPNAPEAGYTVTSPAAFGFVAYGRTIEEAKRSTRQGLEFHYESVLLEGIGAARRAPERLTRSFAWRNSRS